MAGANFRMDLEGAETLGVRESSFVGMDISQDEVGVFRKSWPKWEARKCGDVTFDQ
jgi:hypothetical protein